VVNGILWKLSTGVLWRDLPERYGLGQTCYERFRRWQADGTWQRLLAHAQTRSDAIGEVDWEVVVDATIVRAHQPPAGARKDDMCRDPSGSSTDDRAASHTGGARRRSR
jgi:transposase